MKRPVALGGLVLMLVTVAGCGRHYWSRPAVLTRWPVDRRRVLWAAMGAFGDSDTLGAIVGGIVSMRDGGRGVPEEWRGARESLSVFTRYG
ncbi:MAG TPA: hypothetical protein VFE48_05200 [Methylomirabilota bacterium]|nr:hypothetical protein [Methylomirabilota bacterium]